MVRLVRLERTLYGFSGRSLYRLGYRRIDGQGRIRTGAHAIDHVAPCSQAALIKRAAAISGFDAGLLPKLSYPPMGIGGHSRARTGDHELKRIALYLLS